MRLLGVVVVIAAIILGYLLYPLDPSHHSNLDSKGNIQSYQEAKETLLQLETLVDDARRKRRRCDRVAIGYNANLDLIASALDVLHQMNLLTPQTLQDFAKITSVEEFHQIFSFYFDKGSAAERFAEREVFDRILSAATQLPPEKLQWFTGGNAALMANRFAQEDCEQVLLGGTVGSRLAPLLDPRVQTLPSSQKGGNVEDEIHLILEYSKHTRYGSLTSPRANRFIMQSDRLNGQLGALEEFHQVLPSFSPSVVVLSGLHLLEGQTEDFRLKRLSDIRKVIGELSNLSVFPTSPPVHLELASIGDLSLVKHSLEEVVPHVNSLGLNEQELGSVLSCLSGKDIRSDFKDPNLLVVIQGLKDIFRSVGKSESTLLSRIHFHCLTFHVIAQRLESPWDSPREAVAAGSLATSRQACDTFKLKLEDVDFHPLSSRGNFSDFSKKERPSGPIWEWTEEGILFAVSPVFVCRSPQKTVGLGDAISTVGLVQQIFGS